MKQLLLTAFLTLTLVACGESQQNASDESDARSAQLAACPQADENGNVDVAPGLTARITNKGYGPTAVSGDHADVHTTLWLYDENADGGRGTEIWASGGIQPFQFTLASLIT